MNKVAPVLTPEQIAEFKNLSHAYFTLKNYEYSSIEEEAIELVCSSLVTRLTCLADFLGLNFMYCNSSIEIFIYNKENCCRTVLLGFAYNSDVE